MSYRDVLGRNASWRLQQRVLPGSVWSQQVYGTLLVEQLTARSHARWLDAGCGHRILAQGLEHLEDAAVSSAETVVGMDPSATAMAQHRNIRNRTCAFLDKLPFADGSFDVISCNMVVEHLADPVVCFREIHRVLAPGGVAIFHTPNLWHYMVFLNHTVGRILPRALTTRLIRIAEEREEDDIFKTFYRLNTTSRVSRMAAELGFMMERQRFIPSPQPFFNFFLPAAFVQMLITRAMQELRLQSLESTMLVLLRKPSSHSVA